MQYQSHSHHRQPQDHPDQSGVEPEYMALDFSKFDVEEFGDMAPSSCDLADPVPEWELLPDLEDESVEGEEE